MTVRRVSLCVLLVALIAPAAASAATRYAAPSGTGTACTQPSPCSLAEATDSTKVNPGDEIILGAGTYTTAPEIDLLDDNLNLHGDTSGPRPVIQTSANAAVFSNHTGTSVSYLEIQHTGLSFGLGMSVGDGTVSDVIVRSTSTTACSLSSTTSSVYTMRNSICSTSANGQSALSLGFGNADVRLRNVTAISTATINAHGIRADSDAGEAMSVTGTNVIAAATATDGPSDDIHTLANGAGASTTITLDHSNYDKVFAFVGGMGGTTAVTPAGTNNNQTDPPLFVDAAAGNFHQTNGSPTIDAGSNNALNGLFDIDGDARPDGIATDIGADEFPDADDDDDGVVDISDNCQADANASQANNDADAQGDACDADDDNDTVVDGSDNCQLAANNAQANNDGDSEGDVCDSDDDNDTVDDAADSCPTQAGPSGNGGCPEVPEVPEVPKDTAAPQTTIVSGPAKRVFKRRARFTLSSDDPTARFECSLDGKPFAPCDTSVQYRVKLGKHTFAARAVDAAGNGDASPASWTWKVKRRR